MFLSLLFSNQAESWYYLLEGKFDSITGMRGSLRLILVWKIILIFKSPQPQITNERENYYEIMKTPVLNFKHVPIQSNNNWIEMKWIENLMTSCFLST